MIAKSLSILKAMQTPRGLFVAAADPTTHYSRQAWMRDNFYISLGLEAAGNM